MIINPTILQKLDHMKTTKCLNHSYKMNISEIKRYYREKASLDKNENDEEVFKEISRKNVEKWLNDHSSLILSAINIPKKFLKVNMSPWNLK